MTAPPIDIKPGDWAVHPQKQTVEVSEVYIVGAQIYAGSHEQIRSKAAVVFSGDEASCRRVAEKLTASRAIEHRELIEVTNQRRDRDAQIIASAGL